MKLLEGPSGDCSWMMGDGAFFSLLLLLFFLLNLFDTRVMDGWTDGRMDGNGVLLLSSFPLLLLLLLVLQAGIHIYIPFRLFSFLPFFLSLIFSTEQDGLCLVCN
jgi:hypothetical protein